nr:hypothetical protein Itr_chr02CG02570 [Ipomoea trifida]
MERGSSRLNASIFLNSSSKAWRKQLSFDDFKETSPVADTSARQSEMVLGTPNSLFKSILSFLPSGPIRSLNFLIRDFGFFRALRYSFTGEWRRIYISTGQRDKEDRGKFGITETEEDS